MFFTCKVARSIWSAIQMASNLYQPTSVANIFGNWLNGIDNKLRTILRVGALAVIWSLWLCRNDKIFSDKNFTCLQVLYRCTCILLSWSILQRVEYQGLFMEACAQLEAVVTDISIQHGWPRDLCIELS